MLPLVDTGTVPGSGLIGGGAWANLSAVVLAPGEDAVPGSGLIGGGAW
jgi:hypothetical protein